MIIKAIIIKSFIVLFTIIFKSPLLLASCSSAILQGCVTIVYPMGLPPHDPIRMEFEGKEELEGTQVVIVVMEVVWW